MRLRRDQIHHRGFKPDLRFAAGQNKIDLIAEAFGDMHRRGRAQLAGSIGAWRGNRFSNFFQQLLGDWMRGDAHRERIHAGAGEQRNRRCLLARQHQREWPRPELRGQQLCGFIPFDQIVQRTRLGHMHDQRIDFRPALGCINGMALWYFIARVASPPRP